MTMSLFSHTLVDVTCDTYGATGGIAASCFVQAFGLATIGQDNPRASAAWFTFVAVSDVGLVLPHPTLTIAMTSVQSTMPARLLRPGCRRTEVVFKRQRCCI